MRDITKFFLLSAPFVAAAFVAVTIASSGKAPDRDCIYFADQQGLSGKFEDNECSVRINNQWRPIIRTQGGGFRFKDPGER